MNTFWFIVIFGILAWYLIVGILVGIRGFGNIKQMLDRLKDDHSKS
ncbi:MAG: hypothetical protein KDC80_10805 [Saprospiraceae bacterium]|nr:hypothetical protein [Saprospiraceae bacterium]